MAGTHWPTDLLMPQPKRARSLPQTAKNLDENPRVVLNPADCNIDFNIGKEGVSGSALTRQGFAYCWSGARASIGVRAGRYCFACLVDREQPVSMPDTERDQQNLCRVGVSRGDTDVGCLGEAANSFGYGGTGKFSTAGRFRDYGFKYGVGDTITVAVDMSSGSFIKLSFFKNGVGLGTAIEFPCAVLGVGAAAPPVAKLPWSAAIFPHVLLKNVDVRMQLSVADGLIPVANYQPWDLALGDGCGVQGPRLGSKQDCEVLMMVGLPAAGKSTWAEKWQRDHPEKRYVILGTNVVLDQMKVPGLGRKRNYGERFDRLINLSTTIFNTLLERAGNIPRNYILDQTNVYKTARKRKLRSFSQFYQIAVVVYPTPEQLRDRTRRRTVEMGKEVPPAEVNKMRENFTIPTAKDEVGSDETFNEVWFVALGRDEAVPLLEREKREQWLAAKSQLKTMPAYSSTRHLSRKGSESPSARLAHMVANPKQVFSNMVAQANLDRANFSPNASQVNSRVPPWDRATFSPTTQANVMVRQLDRSSFSPTSTATQVAGYSSQHLGLSHHDMSQCTRHSSVGYGEEGFKSRTPGLENSHPLTFQDPFSLYQPMFQRRDDSFGLAQSAPASMSTTEPFGRCTPGQSCVTPSVPFIPLSHTPLTAYPPGPKSVTYGHPCLGRFLH